MTHCPYGSRPRPTTPGNRAVLIRYADLRQIAVPDLTPLGVTPRRSPDTDEIIGFDLNLTELFSPENTSLYGVIFGPDIPSNFCAVPPPTEFPGFAEGLQNLAAIAAERLWNELCECEESPPNCELYAGLGQCAGIEYRLTGTVTRQNAAFPEETYVEQWSTFCRNTDPNNPGDSGGYYGPLGAVRYGPDTINQLRIACYRRYGLVPRPEGGLGGQNTSDPIISYTIDSITTCTGEPDNCCPATRPPNPPPPDYPEPVFDSDDPSGGEPMTIIFVPCCPGPEGPPGEDGEDMTLVELELADFGNAIGQNGTLDKPFGRIVHGVRIDCETIPAGVSRIPAANGVPELYDLGYMRFFKGTFRSPPVRITSALFEYVSFRSKSGWDGVEVRGEPGTQFIVDFLVQVVEE